jgi:hypothetical protein
MGKRTAHHRTRRNPAETQPYRVFISHATYDKWTATVLCEKIEETGARAFRDDRDIAGGEVIPGAIIDAISDCRELVVLLTPESVKRTWVIAEIGIALGARRRIVPLLHHIESSQIPEIIRDRKGYDLNDLDKYLTELRQRIGES